MRVALIAHDKKKDELIEFIKQNENTFEPFELVATGGTGKVLMKHTSLNVKCLKAGSLGGDHEIGTLISKRELDAVFFFRDPMTPQLHEPDVNTILRLCDVYSIPIATNISSAKPVLEYLKGEEVDGRITELGISKEDLKLILTFVKSQMPEEPKSTSHKKEGKTTVNEKVEEHEIEDPLREKILIYLYETKKASASLLQRKFRIGYNRAARFIEEFEAGGLVGPWEGNKSRDVLISEAHYQELISSFGKREE